MRSTPPAWRKPTRCTANGDCIEVSSVPGLGGLRDSTDPAGPELWLPLGNMLAFAAAVKGGQFG